MQNNLYEKYIKPSQKKRREDDLQRKRSLDSINENRIRNENRVRERERNQALREATQQALPALLNLSRQARDNKEYGLSKDYNLAPLKQGGLFDIETTGEGERKEVPNNVIFDTDGGCSLLSTIMPQAHLLSQLTDNPAEFDAAELDKRFRKLDGRKIPMGAVKEGFKGLVDELKPSDFINEFRKNMEEENAQEIYHFPDDAKRRLESLEKSFEGYVPELAFEDLMQNVSGRDALKIREFLNPELEKILEKIYSQTDGPDKAKKLAKEGGWKFGVYPDRFLDALQAKSELFNTAYLNVPQGVYAKDFKPIIKEGFGTKEYNENLKRFNPLRVHLQKKLEDNPDNGKTQRYRNKLEYIDQINAFKDILKSMSGTQRGREEAAKLKKEFKDNDPYYDQIKKKNIGQILGTMYASNKDGLMGLINPQGDQENSMNPKSKPLLRERRSPSADQIKGIFKQRMFPSFSSTIKETSNDPAKDDRYTSHRYALGHIEPIEGSKRHNLRFLNSGSSKGVFSFPQREKEDFYTFKYDPYERSDLYTEDEQFKQEPRNDPSHPGKKVKAFDQAINGVFDYPSSTTAIRMLSEANGKVPSINPHKYDPTLEKHFRKAAQRKDPNIPSDTFNKKISPHVIKTHVDLALGGHVRAKTKTEQFKKFFD